MRDRLKSDRLLEQEHAQALQQRDQALKENSEFEMRVQQLSDRIKTVEAAEWNVRTEVAKAQTSDNATKDENTRLQGQLREKDKKLDDARDTIEPRIHSRRRVGALPWTMTEWL